MIAAALLMALQGAPPPPVVVTHSLPIRDVKAVSWSCETWGDDGAMSLTGSFPAVSASDQKNGRAYRLESKIESPAQPRFSGTFPAALTFSLVGMNRYSVSVRGVDEGKRNFVFSFEFFEASQDGFLTIASFDSKTGAPDAYAAGLCKTQVSK
jgi:hypothetical protein